MAATETAIQTLSDSLQARGPGAPSTSQVSSAVAELRSDAAAHKAALNTYMTDSFDVVSRHLQQTQKLKQDSVAVQRAMQSVSNIFDLNNPKGVEGVTEFMRYSTARATSSHDQAMAEATLGALKEIEGEYRALSTIEDAIWSGSSLDHSVLASLQTPPSDPAKESQSKVGAAIKSRVALLRSTVSDQLSRAWTSAVSVNAAGTPTVSVKRKVRLQLPTTSRVTATNPASASSPPPFYQLSNIASAMSRLEILSQALHNLHTQILRDVIDVMMSKQNGQATMTEAGDTAVVNLSFSGSRSTDDLLQSIRTVLIFVRDSICTVGVPEMDAFLANLQHETFTRILSRVLIPSIPTAVSALPDWLQTVRRSSELEAELSKSTHILTDFADQEASRKWLAKFRQARLQSARQLSFKTWFSANIKEIELPHKAEPVVPAAVAPSTPRASTPARSTPPTPSTPAEVDDDGGWGFDDDEPPAAPAPPPPAPPAPAAADEDDGWGFNDDDATPAPAPVIAPKPKPVVREAKRLGKKVKTTASSPSARASPSPSPPPQASPKKPAPAPAARSMLPPPPPAPVLRVVQRKFLRVSEACHAVLQLPSEVLREVTAMQELHEPSFKDAASGMTDILTEEMDFICATTAIARQTQSRSSVAETLQLSNGYVYIASKLELDDSVSLWTARSEAAKRFMAQADLLRTSCTEEELAALSTILDGAHRFVDMAHDVHFHQAEAAVQSVVSRLEALARETEHVLAADQYAEFLGALVESIANRLLGDVVALVDITEIESERISAILRHVETLDALFKPDGSDLSMIAAHVPHWLKLCYLKEILHANLVDITYLFESGSLVDFAGAELSRLIQALFADSAKRSALLGKIGTQ